MRLRMRIPPVVPEVYNRPPERCPQGGNTTFHSHGRALQPLRDPRVDWVPVRRIQCPRCQKTQRVYPQGPTARDQSERVRAFSVLLWLLGLSYRGVAEALAGLGVVLKKSQICDKVQAVGEKVRQVQAKRLAKRRVRVLAADCPLGGQGSHLSGLKWGDVCLLMVKMRIADSSAGA